MSELDKNLSWETSSLATYKLLEKAIEAKVKDSFMLHPALFMGLKKKKVTEKLSLKPISLYNKVKMCTERIILFIKIKSKHS